MFTYNYWTTKRKCLNNTVPVILIKRRTNKTYVSFLTELRIENACKLLQSKEEFSISEVAYQVGFNNISNFNRKFKEIKQITPLKYKNM